jgi:hypothetical protein
MAEPVRASGGDHAVEVYIEPASHHFRADRLFAEDESRLNGDRQNAPYQHVRAHFAARGIPVRTADYLPESSSAGVRRIVFSLGGLSQVERWSQRPDVVLSAFFAMECPIVEPSLFRALPRLARQFRRIYSWSDSPSLRHFTGADVPLHAFHWPQSFDDVHESLWNRTGRRFLVMINANKLPRVYWRELYTERTRAVEFFGRSHEIDLYGKGWGEPSIRVGNTWVPWTIKRPWLALVKRWRTRYPDPLLVAARKAWRGPAASKAETLSAYDFALCFENCILRGWITEKIFDCFFAGTVPVYWGAPEITEVIPPECFIDMRAFEGYPQLREFLRTRTPEDLRRYREAAREFLRSPQYRQFSREAFTRIFAECVAQDLDESGLFRAA